MSSLIPTEPRAHSVATRAKKALRAFIKSSQSQLPATFIDHAENVEFLHGSTGDVVCFPCPLQEQEAASALKAMEGAAVAAIADLLDRQRRSRSIEVHLDQVTCFLMSAYMVTIKNRHKQHPEVKELVPDTDIHQAQSVLYRRLSANLYKTSQAGKYYHVHGSLDASKTLAMLGLPTNIPEPHDYRACLDMIGSAVQKLTPAELEARNAETKQAGAPALTKQEFLDTPHGKVMASLPPFTVKRIEGSDTAPVPFPAVSLPSRKKRRVLEGIKVLELCRVIAGPAIGRSLAALGASVLKINSPRLPDITFFQVDVNTGKHTAWIDLTDPGDRAVFESLLEEADVVIDGYRPGVLSKYGCDPEALARRAARRGKGIVYVAEDCFGGTAEPGAAWAHRPGWQQIADCVSGVAWEQGRFMGLDEPVVPPFPMSDYGTGCLGSVAALSGLHRRASEGGSWACRTSLLQYDLFLLSLGAHDDGVQARLRATHDPAFFALRHDDSVDVVGATALESMRRLHPALFDAARTMHSGLSSGFGPGPDPVVVTWPREAVRVEGCAIGHVRVSRRNGNDEPAWGEWETDERWLDDIDGDVDPDEEAR
ncbi:hypothetical protein DL768_007790 [Monosporascus sp. mg162]|nr:hypothetical protein DL768_007790 [Monosporascus sp. mg162]